MCGLLAYLRGLYANMPFWKSSKSSDQTQNATATPGGNGPNTINNPNTNQKFPFGCETWVPCSDATVDICFIHGLTGNRDKTWTASGQQEPWPKRLISEKLPDLRARIITYGFDAYPVTLAATSTTRLTDHANNFLEKLTAYREEEGTEARPLIIVAHSLGGLVTKMAILSSRDAEGTIDDHLSLLYKSLIGIVFMGTPHTGSLLADWGKIAASVLNVWKTTNTDLFKILQTNNELILNLNDRFLEMYNTLSSGAGHKFRVKCFFEAKGVIGAGFIVTRDSATFAGQRPVCIQENHINMVKFASSNADGFDVFIGELRRWTKPAVPIAAPAAPREPSPEHRHSIDQQQAVRRGRPWLIEQQEERSISEPPATYLIQGEARVQFGDRYGDTYEYNNTAYAQNMDPPGRIPRSMSGAESIEANSRRVQTLDEGDMQRALEAPRRPGNTFNAFNGTQYNNTGSGSQYNNTGSGSQVHVKDGSHVFNFGQN